MAVERTHLALTAMSSRPTVTEAQKAARASLAEVAFTPRPTSRVVPQLPNMVSPIPYSTRAAANSQNRRQPPSRAGLGTTMGWSRARR